MKKKYIAGHIKQQQLLNPAETFANWVQWKMQLVSGLSVTDRLQMSVEF